MGGSMKSKLTYINGRDKKLLRKLIQKELKVVDTLIDIDIELYGLYRSPLFYGIIKRKRVLDELYNKIR